MEGLGEMIVFILFCLEKLRQIAVWFYPGPSPPFIDHYISLFTAIFALILFFSSSSFLSLFLRMRTTVSHVFHRDILYSLLLLLHLLTFKLRLLFGTWLLLLLLLPFRFFLLFFSCLYFLPPYNFCPLSWVVINLWTCGFVYLIFGNHCFLLVVPFASSPGML